jgi:hypothetical protein
VLKIGERNSLEMTARRYGFSNSDCKRDSRLGRLVSFKARLNDEIDELLDIQARKLGKAARLAEVDYEDQRIYDLLKAINRSRALVATLRPSPKNAPTKTATKND